MDKFMKVVIALIIVAVLGFVVYCLLPEMPKKWVDAKFQVMTDEDAKTTIESIQNATLKDHPDVTYKTLLEDQTSFPIWYYTVEGEEKIVEFIGSGATFKITDNGDDNIIATDAELRIIFRIQPNGSFAMNLYVDGELQSDEYKMAILDRLYKNYN